MEASSCLCAEAGQEVYIDGGFERFTRRGRPGGIYRRRLRAVYAPRPARRYISMEASSGLGAEGGQEVYIDGGFELFMCRGRPGGIYRRRLRAVYAPRPARRYISTKASSRLRAEASQEVYIDGRFERFRRRGWPGGIYRRRLRAVSVLGCVSFMVVAQKQRHLGPRGPKLQTDWAHGCPQGFRKAS